MVGTYYGSISMLDTIYGNVESELDILESKLKDVNTREVENKLEQIRQQVLNKVPTKESITDLNEQINSLNERLIMLSKELMEVHMELEMELSDLEDNAKIYVNDKFTKSEAEIKKQFGDMYDKVDIIHKDLEEVSIMIDKAKETFFGKSVFKIKEK
jgi:predicted  nucleic acid-binding Zn-ribbon protein